MEPVTHFLTGACLGRAGCNRKTAYATFAMVLAAEAPDLDMVWGFRGPVAELEHHRGITHTFLGAPFMALLVTAFIYGWHRWRMRKAAVPEAGPAVRWVWIWLLALIADLSHILLDWTNNYGVRPFFPFHARWYAGSIFFIFEPILFGALLLAVVMPAILGLADREIGAKKPKFRGQGWAIFALCVAVVLGCWKWAEHERALSLLAQQNYSEAPIKMTVSPFPGSVFQWYGIVESKDFYQTTLLNSRTGSFLSQESANLIYKQPQTAAIRTAEASWLGRVYLDWSQYPVVEEAGISDVQRNGRHATLVRFRDLRFSYPTLLLRRDNPALSGTVLIAPDNTVEEMHLEGRPQAIP